MHLQYVVLCDSVIIANDGKPSLIGIFNELQAPSTPVHLPRVSFAARLLFTDDETGKSYRIEVAITDPSGAEIGRPGGDVTLPPARSGVDTLAVDLPLVFEMLELASPGRYTFLLHVDGQPVGATQLSVRQIANA